MHRSRRRAGTPRDQRHPPAAPGTIRSGSATKQAFADDGPVRALVGMKEAGERRLDRHLRRTGTVFPSTTSRPDCSNAATTYNRKTPWSTVRRGAVSTPRFGRGVTVLNAAAVDGGGALAEWSGWSRPTRTSRPTRGGPGHRRDGKRLRLSRCSLRSRLWRCSSLCATPASPQPWSGPTPLNTSTEFVADSQLETADSLFDELDS